MATTSPFLSSSGELRNRIYEYYAAGITSLGTTRDGDAAPPPLMQICRQVRNEMHSIVDQEFAHMISYTAVAINYNFDHILQFLKRVESMDQGCERELFITIRLTRPCCGDYEQDNVARWNAITSEAPGGLGRTHERYGAHSHWHNLSVVSIFGQTFRVHYAPSGRNEGELLAMFKCGCMERHEPSMPGNLRTINLFDCFYPKEVVQDWCGLMIGVAVNHGALARVSKQRRQHAKTRLEGRVILQEEYVRTGCPKPHVAGLERSSRKRTRVDREALAVDKLMRMLSLRDGGRAYWEEKGVDVRA